MVYAGDNATSAGLGLYRKSYAKVGGVDVGRSPSLTPQIGLRISIAGVSIGQRPGRRRSSLCGSNCPALDYPNPIVKYQLVGTFLLLDFYQDAVDEGVSWHSKTKIGSFEIMRLCNPCTESSSSIRVVTRNGVAGTRPGYGANGRVVCHSCRRQRSFAVRWN